MCDRGDPFGRGELRNNNQQDCVLDDGDANANDVTTGRGRQTADTSTLSGLTTETTEQDKVIIWGTDSQCDDPELAEFEMLECQELEAYLVEDGEDFVGLAERKELHDQSPLCNNATAEQATGNKSKDEGTSDNEAFVSCLSTVSSMVTAMDTLGRTETTDSWHVASGPCSALTDDPTLASQTCNVIFEKACRKADHRCVSSGKITAHPKHVDMNLNSAVHPEDLTSEAQVSSAPWKVHDEHKNNNNQTSSKGSSVPPEGRHDRGRSLEPTAKQSHEESNTKIDKSTQADDNVNSSPRKTGPKGTGSSAESKAIRKQRSFDNTSKKQNPQKQPSCEYTLKKQLSFDSAPKRQGSFENTCRSSSLERWKPWGSPSRPAIPGSPKTTSCSPRRQTPGSPAKVQSTRAQSSDWSPQRASSQTLRPSGKTSVGSGIPKPITPQQKDPETRRSSPPQKPKNVRPKIITYVRKNPQAEPQATDAPPDASTHPLRLSSYSSPPAQKDPKAGGLSKGTAVFSPSSLLFDKYRQEMQRSGYHPSSMTVTGLKPPGSAGSQALSGRTDSLQEEVSERCVQQVRIRSNI